MSGLGRSPSRMFSARIELTSSRGQRARSRCFQIAIRGLAADVATSHRNRSSDTRVVRVLDFECHER